MKTVEFIWDGKPLYLMLNGTALFDILDQYGSRAEILELIEGNDKKSYLNTCWILSKLAEQGELARRFLGHDHATYPTPERLAALMMPLEVPKARRAITRAVQLGFGMQHPADDEQDYVDIGLMELQKKNGIQTDRIQYFQMATQFLHLSVPEAQTLTPGEMADLINLEIKRRHLVRKEG